MKRSEVYWIVDGERDYQDEKWGSIEQRPKQVGAWLTLMRYLLAEAEANWATTDGDHIALDHIRKLTAVGVACMEEHGAPERAKMRAGGPVVKEWPCYFLRDDTEIRRSAGIYKGIEEAYSLFGTKPYVRHQIYGGPKEDAIKQADSFVRHYS